MGIRKKEKKNLILKSYERPFVSVVNALQKHFQVRKLHYIVFFTSLPVVDPYDWLLFVIDITVEGYISIIYTYYDISIVA